MARNPQLRVVGTKRRRQHPAAIQSALMHGARGNDVTANAAAKELTPTGSVCAPPGRSRRDHNVTCRNVEAWRKRVNLPNDIQNA